METVNNGSATIKKSMDGIQISIPSKKNWFVLLFGTAWLGGWYTGFRMAIGTLLSFEDGFSGGNAFMMFWLAGWTIGGLFVMGTLLLGYFGKEDLNLKHNKIELNKHIFGIGQNKAFKKTEVKNVRFNKIEESYFSGKNNYALWGLGEGKIKFDYGMKTYSFGLGLDDAEANHIMDLIIRK